jgi:hypothetical protein
MLYAMILTAKLIISWVKNRYFCFFATKPTYKEISRQVFGFLIVFGKTVAYLNVLILLRIEDSLCYMKVSNMKRFVQIYYNTCSQEK